MDKWLSETSAIIRILVGSPAHGPELITALAVAGGLLLFVLHAVSHATGSSMASGVRTLMAAGIGIILLVSAVAAANLYVCPHVSDFTLRFWTRIGIAVAALLALVVPFCAWCYKLRYTRTLFTVVLAIGAAWGGVMLVNAMGGAARAGRKNVKGIRTKLDHYDEVRGK